MPEKVIVIGAGMAGLSAACYARMNGYEAEIYEMHDKSGGLCTSWKRNDYTIDGCIHWLTGSNPNSNFYKLWSELGAVKGRRMLYHDVFYRYTGSDGRTLVVYCDADKLEAHMQEIFPTILWEKDQPLLNLVATLASLHAKDGGFPQGGSLEFARAIERRCLNLGAKIFYKCRVVKILEENGRAVGIRLADGKDIRGDYIISAADWGRRFTICWRVSILTPFIKSCSRAASHSLPWFRSLSG